MPVFAAVAFAESSVFPIPPDVMLVPMVLSRPKCWIKIFCLGTFASVLGGMLGYVIGFYMWGGLGKWIVTSLLAMPLLPIDGILDIPLPSFFVDHFSTFLGGRGVFAVYHHWNAWIVFFLV